YKLIMSSVNRERHKKSKNYPQISDVTEEAIITSQTNLLSQNGLSEIETNIKREIDVNKEKKKANSSFLDDKHEISSIVEDNVHFIDDKKIFNPRKWFKYEIKLFKMHLPELFWLVIGSIAQMINGVVFPLIGLFFCEIYVIFSTPDENEQ